MKSEWIKKQMINRNKTIPILSFPSIQLLGINVKQLVNDANKQALGMKLIADKCPTSASVSMMDLSVEAEEFGAKIKFSDMDIPSVIGRLINTADDAFNLIIPKVGSKRTKIYLEAMKEASKIINDRPVFAGVIGPFSLAGRLMDMTEIMVNCYLEPNMVHETIRKTTEFITNYINEYKNVGAKGVIIAEPAAGLLSPTLCKEFSSNYIKQISMNVKSEDFIICYHNCGNVIPLLESILDIDADIYHFGNAINIEEVLKIFSKEKLVMGNINPLLFVNGSIDDIKKETINLLNQCSKYENFIISSGCDIPPQAKWDNLMTYFDVITQFYK